MEYIIERINNGHIVTSPGGNRYVVPQNENVLRYILNIEFKSCNEISLPVNGKMKLEISIKQ